MESLADVGLSTVRLFKLLEEVKQPEPATNRLQGWSTSLFLAQFDRFELWAVNLGLFVMGHGSLDYRIRDSESMRESIYMMIQNLNRSLNEVLDYVNGNTGQEDEDSDTDSEPESDMDLLLESIRDPIDRLYKLAVWIRNPATRLTSSKARNFKQIDPESNMDLFESYENYDYDYISSLFLEYDKHKAMQENTAVECKDKNPVSGDRKADDIDHVWEPIRGVLELNKEKISNGTESYLVRRIARANGRRRQQFAYWKKHKDKLRQHASTVVEAPERQLFNAERIASGPMEETKTPLSVTTATQLRLAQTSGKEILEKEGVLKVDVSEYAPSAWNPSKDTVSFPPPPKITTSDNFFECPYCFTICPISLLSEKAWRAHIIRDLRPYVCTYEHCLNSEQLYDTRDDWIQHENSTHERIFRCFEHEEADFATLEAYEEHVEDHHKDGAASSNMAISAIRNANRSCPVCSIVLGSIQKLQSHIALHLERFAMFSLPRNTDNNEQSEAESQSNNARLDSSSFSVSASVLDSYPIEKFDGATEHFPGRESLDEHKGTVHPRPYICVFHYAGCTARFDAKNEWKRHVNTMHLGLKYWVCMEGKCADEQQSISEQRAGLEPKGNVFNRKDLYTQHIHRMHSNIIGQRMTDDNLKSADSRFDFVTKWMQEDALRIRCRLPTWMPCPVQSCDESFKGSNAWDERMEHVAQQHFEKAAAGQESPVEFGGLHDYVLTDWAQRPEINIVKQTEMGWELCNPLKGDTEYRMATTTSDGEDRLKEEEDHNDQENAEAQEEREQIEAEMQIFLHASRLLWEDVNKEVELENEEAQAGSEARDLARRMEVMRLEFETLKDQYAQEAPREQKAQKAQELTNQMRSFVGYVQGAVKEIQTNRKNRQALIVDGKEADSTEAKAAAAKQEDEVVESFRPIHEQVMLKADELKKESTAENEETTEEVALKKAALEEAKKKAEEAAKRAELAPIKFKDAVGRKFSFPFHLCSTWQGMEELIKQAFMHVDILGPHVQEGHYDLIGPNDEIILPSVWEKVIQPGWAITMTMWPLDKAPPVGGPKLPPGMPPMSQRPDGHGPPFPPTVISPLGRRRGMPMPPPPPPPEWNGSLPPPPWGPPGGASPNIKIVNAAPPPKREKGPKSKKKNVSMLDFISGKPMARKSSAARNRREMEDITPSPKNVAFELLSPESSLIRRRLPMRVQIHPHDTTDSIVTTVKNYYGLYSSPTESKGISFEDEHGNTLIARYENFRQNMTIYVRVVEETNNLQRDIHSEMGGEVMAETSNKEGEKAAESGRAVRIQLEELVQANANFRPNIAKGKAKEQEGEGETETGVEEANSTEAKATTAKETEEVDEPNTKALAEIVATVEPADGKEEEEATKKISAHLLQGCYLEAERSGRVWLQLQGLFQALPETNRRHLQSLIDEIKSTNLILRELADLFQVHQDRVPLVLDPLNIVLPCLSRSLRDIVTHYENRKLTKENRWRTMFHEMTNEAGGLQLPQRFVVYNYYLTSIRKLLSRSPDFDPNMMEAFRLQIMNLREARGIPLPARGVFGERTQEQKAPKD